jgi:hypothetical protein
MIISACVRTGSSCPPLPTTGNEARHGNATRFQLLHPIGTVRHYRHRSHSPLRGPDEPAHLWRAIGISQGDLIPTTTNEHRDVGLFISARWHQQFSHFNEVRQKLPHERPNYWELFQAPLAKELPVNGSEPAIFVTYEGSQVYSPIPYLAYAAAALVARALGLSWLETLYLLRFVGLLVAAPGDPGELELTAGPRRPCRP